MLLDTRDSQDDGRRYAIKPDEGYFFYAGVTPDKKQVLMGLYPPDLVAFSFDKEGNLLRVDQRPLASQGVPPPYKIYKDRIPQLIEAWKKEVGFRPATIRVRKFFSAEHGIGIEDYPSHFHEILADPETSDEEKADVRDSIEC
jgi:hypothetical protein